ncbi:Hypothetical_protein [Hexamita inflata]|uniref:Hypothetical_protein n=1 Tax=Hexamita inflata TaxID=28002 RepID=A0AA86U3V5_9EUKA|nr:Hypothetical protein HINF_LOCUS24632 [Hexamita inflata]
MNLKYQSVQQDSNDNQMNLDNSKQLNSIIKTKLSKRIQLEMLKSRNPQDSRMLYNLLHKNTQSKTIQTAYQLFRILQFINEIFCYYSFSNQIKVQIGSAAKTTINTQKQISACPTCQITTLIGAVCH